MAVLVQQVALTGANIRVAPYRRRAGEVVRSARARAAGSHAPDEVNAPFGEMMVYSQFTATPTGTANDHGLVIHFSLPTEYSYRMLSANLSMFAANNNHDDTVNWKPAGLGSAQFHRPTVPEAGQEQFDFSDGRPMAGAEADAQYWNARRWWVTPYYRGSRTYVAKPLPGILRAPKDRAITFQFMVGVATGKGTYSVTSTFWANFLLYSQYDAFLVDQAAPTPVIGI